MLKQDNRIRKKKDIENILKKGKSLKQDFLILKNLENNLNICRFGFIVSQKVSKKAVERNRIKRRAREIIRLKINSLIPKSDNLLIFLPGSSQKSNQEIKQTIEKLFKKARING